ncbi:MAG: Mfa1 family fimbria major subunit [Tannerellaceae bacterium]|nr:Mfa1 family fimbria major subunit [Tannerellaceae bacterium]
MVDGPDQTDPKEISEGTAIVTIALSAENVSTKSATDFYDNSPQGTEAVLNNYTILIFKEDGTLEKAVSGNFPAGSSSNEDTEEIEVSAGIKLFFAAINTPAGTDLSSITSVTALKAYELAVTDLTQIVDHEQTPGHTGFLMTTLEDSDNLSMHSLRVSIDENDVQTIPLKVGRAMAKVSVASNLTQPTLSGIEYRVLNNPVQMYLASFIDGGIYKTPFWKNEYQTGSLYVDPANYFDTYSNSNNSYTTVSVDGAKTAVYAMENSNELPRQGNATAVSIRGKYDIESAVTAGEIIVLDENGDPDTYTNGSSFWRVYKEVGGIKVYQDDVVYTSEPDLAVIEDGSYTEAVEYVNGVSYYTVWLRNNALATHYYTVKRNQYFKVDINTVNGLGEPNETIEPEIPLEGDALIVVNIDVQDWEDVDQGVDL